MIKITLEFENFKSATQFIEHNAPHLRAPSTVDGADEEPKAEEPKAEEPKAEEPKAEEPKAEEPKAEEPKKGRRRGRPTKEDTKAEEPKKGRRRGRPTKEDTKAEEPEKSDDSDGDISDADMSKAASEAAKDLGVQPVLDELGKFNVSKVSELEQPDRKKFLSRLRELLNPEEGSDNPAFS